ncbi:MAG: hypothetical protein IT462_06185 [Planctomycetes bacterium]|nr:hypothetical protein [Planctomycetota bacterium]
MDKAAPAHVDAMFRETGTITKSTLTLSKPALVNDLNGAYEIYALGFLSRASLSANGQIQAGTNAVLTLEFRDFGDITVLQVDDKDVSLRAELGPSGKVLHAILGSDRGRVTDGYMSYENDLFESGSYQMLYEGPDVVVGRADLKFRKYTVAVNFRAPRTR